MLQQVLTSLQERVLGFIKLLHDSELERKRLRNRVKSLTESEQQLHRVEQASENMELELAVLRNQVLHCDWSVGLRPVLLPLSYYWNYLSDC